jgi:hypothetical protein
MSKKSSLSLYGCLNFDRGESCVWNNEVGEEEMVLRGW